MRNFVFGVEDSLVSTVGLLSGIAVAGVDGRQIFITGVILIVVEAFSMGVGSFLAEDAAEELIEHKKKISLASVFAALIMFVSYSVAGVIPLVPYLLWQTRDALIFSIIAATFALFLLGGVSAYRYNRNPLVYGLRTALIGGLAIAAGVAIGNLLHVTPK